MSEVQTAGIDTRYQGRAAIRPTMNSHTAWTKLSVKKKNITSQIERNLRQKNSYGVILNRKQSLEERLEDFKGDNT